MVVRLGRQLRSEQDDGRAWLRRHRVAGQRAVGAAVGAVRTFDTVTRADDRIAPYSSRGPSWYDGFAKPDIVAPGDNLLSVGGGRQHAPPRTGGARQYRQLHAPLRHQHGGRRGQRHGRPRAAGQPRPDAERGEGGAPVLRRFRCTRTTAVDSTRSRRAPARLKSTGAVALARAINPQAPVGSPGSDGADAVDDHRRRLVRLVAVDDLGRPSRRGRAR